MQRHAAEEVTGSLLRKRLGAAALAVGKGQTTLAEAILELEPSVIQEFMD